MGFDFMLNLIQAYETYLVKVKQASHNTVCSYMRDIRQFAEWLEDSGDVDLLSVSPNSIDDYLTFLQSSGKSGATVSRTLASIKNFYAYAISSGFLETSPISSNIHIPR